MDHDWTGVAELASKLAEILSKRHPGEVTELAVSIEGDTVVLSGEVASEHCRGDAKRQALGFSGVFKVANRLVVAAFLEAASGADEEDDYFGDRSPRQVPLSEGGRGGVHRLDKDGVRATSSDGGYAGGGRIEGPGVEYASFQGDDQPDAVEVSRFPTIEMSGELSAGATISLMLDLSTTPTGDEVPIEVGGFPADWTEIELSVQIVGAWLQTVTPANGTITLRRYGPTTPARFECTIVPGYMHGAPAVLQVYYLHGTRICGSMKRDLAPAATTVDPAATAVKRAPTHPEPTPVRPVGAVTVAPDAYGPALSVMISDAEGEQHWSWNAYGPQGYSAGSGQVQLGSTAKAFADTLLSSCPDLPAETYRRTMQGIGETIWRKSPAAFRQAYLECRRSLGVEFPIQFSSDDPHVPWEMMKPDVDGGALDHLYLEHPVARWPLNTNPPRPTFPEGIIVSFVPDYQTRTLTAATQEGAWMCATLSAIRMVATRGSFLDLMDGKLDGPVRMIHFAGHGRADSGSNDGGIELEDGPVGLMEVNQAATRIGRRDGPLLVLNACEASAGAEMLGMNTGWGAAVAATSFGGLIAPLWSVQDSAAFQMVQDSLPGLVAGRATLGAAVREARCRNADTSVAALAYLAHGDVMARFARS